MVDGSLVELSAHELLLACLNRIVPFFLCCITPIQSNQIHSRGPLLVLVVGVVVVVGDDKDYCKWRIKKYNFTILGILEIERLSLKKVIGDAVVHSCIGDSFGRHQSTDVLPKQGESPLISDYPLESR